MSQDTGRQGDQTEQADQADQTDSFADNAAASSFTVNGDDRRLVAMGVDPKALMSDRAKTRADEVALIRTKLASSADGHLSRAASKLLYAPDATKRMSDADYKAFSSSVTHAARLANLDKDLAALETQYRSQVRVVGEVNPYADAGSPHSWISDVLHTTDSTDSTGRGSTGRGDGGHNDRLQRHGAVVIRALERGTEYGKMIERQWADTVRQANVEQNRRVAERTVREYRTGIATGGGTTVSASGGGAAAFVTPQLLLDHFATYRSPARVVADQLNGSVALPSYGLTCYIPQITAGTSVTTTVEGGALSEADPTMGFVSGSVVEKSGMVSVSQAVLDRVGPGMTADQFLVAQLKDQLGAAIDAVAINALLISPNTTTNATATFALASVSGVGGFYKDLRGAKKGTIDTAGTQIHASHLFVPSDFADFIEAWADSQGHPVFEPHYDGTADLPEPGYSGYCVQSLRMYSDDNLPLSGSNFQLVVTQPQYTLLLEGTPTFSIVPQFGAANLEPVIRVNCYVAAVARYPKAVSTLTGAFYAQSNFA